MIHESMIIDRESAALQTASKALFGNQDRLIVSAAVAQAEPGDLYAQSIAAKLGISDNRVGPQLARLEAVGLLTRLPKVGSERRVYFARRESAYWKLSVALCNELSADSPTRSRRSER
jgi:DNA-binding MarR family transcriptional regulator